MPTLRRTIQSGSTAVILVALLGAVTMASATDNKKAAPAPAPSRPAPAPAARPAPAPAPRPAGSPGGGAAGGYQPRPSMGAPANRPVPAGPSANHPTTNMPSANHPTTNFPSANHPTTNAPSANHPTTTMPVGNRPGTTGPGMTGPGAAPNRSGAGPGANSVFHSPTPRGSNERTTGNGNVVRTRPNGKLSDVHDARSGTDVHHGLNGNRRVSVERADHSRVFAERGRRGFVQRPYSFHGHDFARRSYFYHGRSYDRFYRGYGYRGVFLNVYSPGFYFAPGFYGWAYNPWAMPITFGWGWGGSPWYGYYGGYFSPYSTYPSAAYWLTDYMISTDLQAAYAAHQEAGEVDGAPYAAGGPPELTPDVKQQIADEVRNQLALENQEAQQNAQQQDIDPASSGVARMLGDGRPHVFVAGAALDLVDANGQECGISDGDVLALRTPPPSDATQADLVVMASKGGQECQKGNTVTVQLADLQEMQNQMRETIDQGLQELQAKQGKGGLPPAPPSAQVAVTPAVYTTIAPPPDANVASEIQQETQQGDQAEQGVGADVPPQAVAPIGAAPTAPASVGLGQTPDQVRAALGQPARIANLGPKAIYYYDGMKVIFINGKVSDVQ